jgi:hypothetical protein
VEAWDKAVDGFKAWLVEADTDPAIQYCITQTLQMQDPASLFSAYANAGSTTLSSPTLASDAQNLRILTDMHLSVATVMGELQTL